MCRRPMRWRSSKSNGMAIERLGRSQGNLGDLKGTIICSLIQLSSKNYSLETSVNLSKKSLSSYYVTCFVFDAFWRKVSNLQVVLPAVPTCIFADSMAPNFDETPQNPRIPFVWPQLKLLKNGMMAREGVTSRCKKPRFLNVWRHFISHSVKRDWFLLRYKWHLFFFVWKKNANRFSHWIPQSIHHETWIMPTRRLHHRERRERPWTGAILWSLGWTEKHFTVVALWSGLINHKRFP